jgi:MFS family permease
MAASPALAGEKSYEFGPRYASYALTLIVLVATINIIDRSIVSMLLQPIAQELKLADWQLGFFTGPAFSAAYAISQLAIAELADRRRRSRIIALALAFWSAMTALQGAATSFVTLALARIAVGVGEAGSGPASNSLLSDYFPVSRRGRALAAYSFCVPIGASLGWLIGGWMRELVGWRAAFFVVGVPGLALALLISSSLREPSRGYWDSAPRVKAAASLRETLRFMLSLPTFRQLLLAYGVQVIAINSGLFLPVFFERSHGFSPGLFGTAFAAFSLVSGVAGSYLGGWLGDRFGGTDPRWYMRIPVLSNLVGIPIYVAFFLVGNGWVALTIFAAVSLLPGPIGLSLATTQNLAPPSMRARAAALILVFSTFAGGFGPQIVGILSDELKPSQGIESLRYALLITVITATLWASVHYWLGSRTLPRDLAAKETLA